MTNFRHILVPIDFEPSSRKALEVACDLASKFDARLTIFHAWDIPANAYAGMLSLAPEVWTSLAQAAQEQLDKTVARTRERFSRAEGVLARGPAAFEILAATERTKADLIVIGTHGRKGLGRFLLGSVAEKVVRASPVPVLTVRGEADAGH